MESGSLTACLTRMPLPKSPSISFSSRSGVPGMRTLNFPSAEVKGFHSGGSSARRTGTTAAKTARQTQRRMASSFSVFLVVVRPLRSVVGGRLPSRLPGLGGLHDQVHAQVLPQQARVQDHVVLVHVA